MFVSVSGHTSPEAEAGAMSVVSDHLPRRQLRDTHKRPGRCDLRRDERAKLATSEGSVHGGGGGGVEDGSVDVDDDGGGK